VIISLYSVLPDATNIPMLVVSGSTEYVQACFKRWSQPSNPPPHLTQIRISILHLVKQML